MLLATEDTAALEINCPAVPRNHCISKYQISPETHLCNEYDATALAPHYSRLIVIPLQEFIWLKCHLIFFW